MIMIANSDSSAEKNFKPRYRPDIDGLRALAILPVVVFHAFPRYAPGGFVGVDIFFVISGYLISLIIFRSLSENNFSFTEFYAHRVRRIFPALIVVLAACYAMGWLALLPNEFKSLGKHMAAGAGFVQNFVLQREAGYFDIASELKPLLHLWSLSVEEQFYLVFPFVVWLLWWAQLNLLTGVALIALISFALSRKGVHTDAVKAFFWPHTRFWELMAGAILAYVHAFRAWPDLVSRALRGVVFNRVVFRRVPEAERQGKLLRDVASFIGLALILASIATYSAKTPWPGSRAIAPVLGGLLIIASGPHAWINRKLLAAKPMIWIGLISYPLYLWHWPLLSFLRIVEGEVPAREWRIAAVLLSFALAALTYRLIEKPIRHGAPRVWKNALLCLMLIAAGVLGFDAFQRDGLPLRESINQNGLASLFVVRDTKNQARDPAYQELFCKSRFPEVPFCRLSKDADPSIVIVGDSHSSVLYPGLVDVLSSSAAVVANLAHSGVVPFRDTLSINRTDSEEQKAYAIMAVNRMLDGAKVASVKTVVFVSRGPLYLSGKGFAPDNFPDEKIFDWRLQYLPRPDITDHYTVWETAMRATLDELIGAGKRVIVVLDVPELGFDPLSCFERPYKLTPKPVRSPCAVARLAFEERNREYRALVTRVLRDYPQVALVDAAKPFCDDVWCWAAKDGKVLYYDDDHVSLEGARLIAREILPYLNISQ